MRAGSHPRKITTQSTVTRNALLYPGERSRQEEPRASCCTGWLVPVAATPSRIAAPHLQSLCQEPKFIAPNAPKYPFEALHRRKEKGK